MSDLQPLILAAVAILGVLIAYFQWRTAHQRVVLDLFDRRLRIFELAGNACASIISSGKDTVEALRQLHEAKGNARFLFGDDVNAYLKDRITDLAFLVSFTDEVIRESPEQQQSILIDKKYKAMTKIAEYQNEASAIFAPYMKLNQRMPSAWLPW